MAKENEGCVQVPNLNSEWTVILVNRNTGLHGQFLHWKIMGPIFIELGLRYLWETQVQMPRIELDVQVWTENLGVVNLFSAVRTIPSPYSQSKAVISQLCSISIIRLSFLLFSVTIATLTFQSLLFSR